MNLRIAICLCVVRSSDIDRMIFCAELVNIACTLAKTQNFISKYKKLQFEQNEKYATL